MAVHWDSVVLRFGLALLICAPTLLSGGCGGGGNGGGASGANTPPPTSTQPPAPPPTPNRPPVLAIPNGTKVAVHRHPFSYDASQGGTAFSDPDGDALRYEIKIGHVWNPYSDPNPPAGLRAAGPMITGAPEELEAAVVTVTAIDSHGQTASDQFTIRVVPNTPPAAINPQQDHVLSVGAHVDLDATASGTSFSDADGDALTYEVSLRGDARGLSITGTRVSGVLSSVGLVEVTVRARDPYDGVAADVFLIAAPAIEPGAPMLPAVGFIYRDEELELPFIFRLSSESQIPLWDTQPADNRTTNAGAALGRVLFYDKRLSITNTVACASCHEQSNGFARPERFSVGALGIPLKRNAMALANTRYNIQDAWFSDMRVRTLEQLVLEPLQNPEELGSSLQLVESKLRAASFYPPLFEAAFGSTEITVDRIARALAQFLRALISYRSEFDRAYNSMSNGPGDPASVFDAQELRGLEIFTSGIGNCSLCHQPNAHANEWHANNGIDEIPTDPGALDPAFQRDGAVGVFRAASLRNIAVTGPYMHDGRFVTLRDVIDHYDHGIKESPNLDPLLRVHGPDGPRRMNLSDEDKAALEAFLRTLTDDAFLTDPKFSDPFQ